MLSVLCSGIIVGMSRGEQHEDNCIQKAKLMLFGWIAVGQLSTLKKKKKWKKRLIEICLHQ